MGVSDLDGGGAWGFTLVIDGRTLDWALQAELEEAFLALTRRCRSVICCRSTPLQKSQVVKLIRDALGVMTLAIGEPARTHGGAGLLCGCWIKCEQVCRCHVK